LPPQDTRVSNSLRVRERRTLQALHGMGRKALDALRAALQEQGKDFQK
jgi:hypothetical protein